MTSDPFDKDKWFLDAVAAGAVRVDIDGRILKPGDMCMREVKLSTHAKTGRVYFMLTFRGITKSMLVNRAVALVHLPNPKNLPQVNHINGVKADNWAWDETKTPKCNLEWSSRADNEKHAFRTGLKSTRGSANANAKLTAADVLRIREAPADTLEELRKTLNISAKTVRDIRERRTWTHV